MTRSITLNDIDSGPLQTWSTVAFWVFGLTCAAILAYTTRYFLNSDGLTYLEMAEGLREGRWRALVNLGTSPLYAVLLAAGGTLLDTTRSNELVLLKTLNLLIFLGSLAACHFLLRSLQQSLGRSPGPYERPLPFALLILVGYGAFLVASLTWVRIRLVNPDLLVVLFVLLCCALILRIRTSPAPYLQYALLGALLGLGYLSKTFFLPFGVVILFVAASAVGSVRKAVPRLVLAAVVFAVVAAPLVVGLSKRAGRFSFGEIGSHAYVTTAAKEGRPLHAPSVLHREPLVLFYDLGSPVTDHRGFDVAHWTIGMHPELTLGTVVGNVGRNLVHFFDHSPWFFIVCGLWFAVQASVGSLRRGRLWPPAVPLLLGVPALVGIGAYLLVHLEARYIACFVFAGFVALAAWPRYDWDDTRVGFRTVASTVALSLCFVGVVISSTFDQSVSGLVSTDRKLAPKDRYAEDVAMQEYLHRQGVEAGDVVAAIDSPPIYWARLANVRVKGRVAGNDAFLSAAKGARKDALAALQMAGVRAVIAHGSGFGSLAGEGWEKPPGTTDYYVALLDDAVQKSHAAGRGTANDEQPR